MIHISDIIERRQKNFWNNCIFHPTDAVEDPWGKRILDRMAEDGAIQTVRIYAMFEDIVYEDGDGKIAYDFRLSDMRLDYLVQKGYDILIAYGMMPKLLSSDDSLTASVSKGKLRYKGKLLYNARPKDYALWEEICYEYTKHIVERYGIERVSKWHLHCYNEPDHKSFFLGDLPKGEDGIRAKEYLKLYEGFVKGATRCSDHLCLGGPALASNECFLDLFLKGVKEKGLRLDYIALHNYAKTDPKNAQHRGFCTDNWMDVHYKYEEILRKNGFEDTEIVVDEWGMACAGFYNVEECPVFIERETELFASYYVRLIHTLIRERKNISRLMLCLSGQHEMTSDFSGFRNFFTLNFFKKPIYNAFIMASRLYEGLLPYKTDNESIYAVATKNDCGNYAVLLTYCENNHERTLPAITEQLSFAEDITGKRVTVFCIDGETTNPYALYKKMGITEMTEECIHLLREEGRMKPSSEYVCESSTEIPLLLTSNATYLVLVSKTEA